MSPGHPLSLESIPATDVYPVGHVDLLRSGYREAQPQSGCHAKNQQARKNTDDRHECEIYIANQEYDNAGDQHLLAAPEVVDVIEALTCKQAPYERIRSRGFFRPAENETGM